MSRRISILGAGESGVGASLLAKKQGYDVFVSDLGTIKDKYAQELASAEIEFEYGKHSEERILSSDEVVKSPGIPEKAPLIKQLLDQGTPVISEIEFAGRHTDAKKVIITGTNGKTTTTTLIHHVLTKGGIEAGIAGNIGKSFARLLVEEDEKDVYVLEVSSFQLDGMFDFKANIAILLNITPDHLDRYNYELQNYIDSKFRVIQNQGTADHFITNADDPIIQAELEKRSLPMNYWPVSLSKTIEALQFEGAGIDNNLLQIQTKTELFTMKIQELALQGKHNLFNSMAAGVTARLFELRKEIVRDSLTNFDNIEHRLEFVAKVHGVSFINDSKATNINSTWYALESMDRPTIWIAGGVDKGNDYSELYELTDNKVKALICLGKDNEKLKQAFEGRIETILDASSATEAVGLAYEMAYDGDTVLLSPACASFDLFENYEDRGHRFKSAVRRL
ncbi:MAG: UDP-N-acetylmuramoyl-L-alanine--D-glutamate ligase [Flavobacteriales bacterium]|nr:UDP-N-acetylmuramoyl-L-alanine--D-glutamate ligase [Flavobacteriales bacterium]